MRTTLLCALLIAPLLSGCLAAAAVGAGAALVVSQDMLDNNTFLTRLNSDVTEVWPQVKLYLSEASTQLIEVDDDLRMANAKIDGCTVTVSVEAYDYGRSDLTVRATRFGLNRGDIARVVTDRITRRMEKD